MDSQMGHKWFVHPKFKPLVLCKSCGIVKMTDGHNSPCKGKVRVVLRENRISVASTDPPC